MIRCIAKKTRLIVRNISYIDVTFHNVDGSAKKAKGEVGQTLLSLAHQEKVNLEGACEGSCACSTCHVIINSDDMFKKLKPPCEEEEDLLDSVPECTEKYFMFCYCRSRLACQITLEPELNGIEVTLPKFTKNFYVDGHIPKPH